MHRKAASDAAKSWNRRLAPLSIFVSRKTQRLYIRQGHVKVFDVPVTIREPEKPVGTHLFVAMPPEKGRVLVALASSDHLGCKHGHRGIRKAPAQAFGDDEAPVAAPPAVSASEALDRIEVAPEVREKISEMLWAGSSLIVSDKAISGESGDYTDFIILTR